MVPIVFSTSGTSTGETQNINSGCQNEKIFLNTYIFNNLNSLVGYIYNLMKSPDDFSYYQINILQILKEIYDRSKERSSKINQNIDEVWKLIDKEGSSSSEEESKYFEAYLELGEFINKKIKSLNIETISDIEVLMRKLNSIRELVESTRLSSLKQIRYLADYLYSNSPEYCYSNIKDTVRSYPDCIENLSEFRKSIDKII
jgi:Mg2+ and Co2+ transporter CorA